MQIGEERLKNLSKTTKKLIFLYVIGEIILENIPKIIKILILLYT